MEGAGPRRGDIGQKGFDVNPRFLESFEKRLRGPKPGLDAQLRMSPDPRPGMRTVPEVETSCFKAGVLVLLYPVDERLHLVLTRRTEGVEHHQGQISFPGGRKEPGENLEQTALREAEEELRIPTASLRVLGALTPLYIPPSRYCIYPTVGFAGVRPAFSPSPEEVAEVIEIPLDHLRGSEHVRSERWTIRGVETRVVFYASQGHKIWGATAMVLAELMEVIKTVQEMAS